MWLHNIELHSLNKDLYEYKIHINKKGKNICRLEIL
jgi:hypothetical protein